MQIGYFENLFFRIFQVSGRSNGEQNDEAPSARKSSVLRGDSVSYQ